MVFSNNNFDLIRLFAATNVAAVHAIYFFEIDGLTADVVTFFKAFPGVPIFFFISGLLISRSYENSRSLTSYSLNRILRIYPALIVCTVLAFVSVYLSGYLSKTNNDFMDTAAWLFGQITVFQFYNPDFMRSFGTGVLNGSLWTITVELQFYVLTPLIYIALPKDKLKSNLWILAAMAVSIAAHHYRIFADAQLGGLIYFKLFNVSFIPWIFMFLFGIFVQRNFELFHRLLKGKFLMALAGYVVIYVVANRLFELEYGNNIHSILFLALSLVVLSAAYSLPSLSGSTLNKNDVSYGIYIYHIPIINLMMYYQLSESKFSLGMLVVLAVSCAILSWRIVESPALRLKGLFTRKSPAGSN